MKPKVLVGTSPMERCRVVTPYCFSFYMIGMSHPSVHGKM